MRLIKISQSFKKRIFKVIIAIILTLPLGVDLVTSQALASSADFDITTNYNISYNPPDDFVVIEEEMTLKANNTEYYYPAQSERMLFLPDFDLQKSDEERKFKKESIVVKDERGIEIDTRTVEVADGIEVYVSDTRDVTYWNQEQFTIIYKTHELSDLNGNIANLYIPGLPEDTEFDTVNDKYGIKTHFEFNTNLIVPKTAPEASFLSPSNSITSKTQADKRIYTINAKDRLGETAWIQLGTTQYYYFKMHQITPKTDNIIPKELSQYSDLISTNLYELPLPKEHDETNQRVYFTNISPMPTDIRLDSEGNYIATFEVPANAEGEIIVEGYILLENSLDTEPIPDSSIVQYVNNIKDDIYLRGYIQPDNYWESDSAVVSKLATDLSTDVNSLLELIEIDYNYIIGAFDYSYEKVGGENKRLGALAALQGANAVCMEYSDAMIALLRAQGIAARAAIGYGNDPTGAENIIGDDTALVQNIGHQWLQVWIPEYGWLSVDPTWGESGRRYIGSNLDHILWYTVGDSEQGYVGTSLSTADPVAKYVLTSYDVSLKTLSKEEFEGVAGVGFGEIDPVTGLVKDVRDSGGTTGVDGAVGANVATLTPLSDIVHQYDEIELDEISTFIKTTSIGKILVITIPLLALFLGVSVVTGTASAIMKRGRRRKERNSRTTDDSIIEI